MRTDGGQHQHGSRRRDDRTACRQAVSGGDCGCRYDDPVSRKRIQILAVDKDLIIHHPEIAEPVQDDIIQRHVLFRSFPVHMNASRQHHPLFYGIVVCNQTLQRRLYILFFNLCQVSQVPHVDPQKRDPAVCQLPRRPKQRPVSAQYENPFHIFRGKLAVQRRFLLFLSADHTVLSPGDQIIRNLMGQLQIHILVCICNNIKCSHMYPCKA